MTTRSHGLNARLLNVAVLGLSVLVMLGLAELSLRWFYPRSDRYLVLPANQVTLLEPDERYITGVHGVAEYRTSSWGIRGGEFGADGSEYRILAIGGSTTQNGYLDQSETWTLVLGDLLGPTASGLRTWTGDVGSSGRTARSHVLQIEALLPQFPRIDAVVMLVGVNDLTTALRQGFGYTPPPSLDDPVAHREQVAQAFAQVPGRLHDRLTAYEAEGVNPLKRLALFQLARTVKATLEQSRSGLAQDPFGEIYVTWRRHRTEAPNVIDSLPDLGPPLAEYRGYLEAIVRAARENRTRLVFITQPTLWRADLDSEERAALWLGGTGDFQNESGHDYFSAGALEMAMAAYNAELLDVCETFDVECVDVASVVPKDLTMFYDDVHFTEEGSRLVAETLADHFRKRPPYG